MDRINAEEAVKISKDLNGNSWWMNPFYLTAHCFSEKANGDILIYEQDVTDDGYNLIHLPKSRNNWPNQRYIFISDEEVNMLEKERIEVLAKREVEKEYIYLTENFINMDGSDFHKFRKIIKSFENKYDYQVLDNYPTVKLIEFVKNWAEKRRKIMQSRDLDKVAWTVFEESLADSLSFINSLSQIEHKGIFILVDDKLVGFRISCLLPNGNIVALMQKIDYKYTGLSRFLYHLTAKAYGEKHKYFLVGTGAKTVELADFKLSLRPSIIRPVYFVETGEKK